MKVNKIITCISIDHELYHDNIVKNKIKVGKAYKCIEELQLNSDNYYIPKYAALQGVTVVASVGKFGYNRPCLPKCLFRESTKIEAIKYYIRYFAWLPYCEGRILAQNLWSTIHRRFIMSKAEKAYWQEQADYWSGEP